MAEPPPAVLSIQSQVAYGHVGNSAAVLPLQRLGFEVVALNTVQLAHHPGYGAFAGAATPAPVLTTMLDAIERVGALARCRALLSGYLGEPDAGAVVADAARRLKAAQPDAVYLCDPVIGDEHSGVFVRPGVTEAIRDLLLPLADVVTPNAFELALLSGRPVKDPASALEAARALRAPGIGTVVATGLPVGDPGRIGVLGLDGEGAWLVATPRHDAILHGTGDALSALFLGHLLRAGSVREALPRAVAAMYALVEATVRTGEPELALVLAQDALLAPPECFPVSRVG